MSNEMTSQNQITEGGILRPLLAFFFPILLGTFFQQLYNTADAVVVGNYVGTVALAAVGGSTGTLIGLFVNLFVGVASGSTVIIAQCYGAQYRPGCAVRCRLWHGSTGRCHRHRYFVGGILCAGNAHAHAQHQCIQRAPQ